MAARYGTAVIVGLAERVPDGKLIRPQFESQSIDGVPDLVAMRGIVRGVKASNLQLAGFRVIRDIVRRRLPDHGFGGQVSAHWDSGQRQLFMGASPYAKQIATEYANEHDGVAGYLHFVDEGGFEPQEAYSGPDGLHALTAVRVIGSRALIADELTDMFGNGFGALTDPLDHPDIVYNLRAVFASGALTLANMAASAAHN